jgi:endonuclease/exonuclease/phosphatase family metal-dependent hydrolase
MTTIRFATYNIHKARGLDGRTRIDRIARVLAEFQPDVAALQEVVCHEGQSPEHDQPRYLSQALERFHAMGQTRRHRGGAYGNVTLSRWNFELARHIDLSIPQREQRGVLRTDIRTEGLQLHVFNMHLGTAHRERRAQAERLLDKDFLRAIDIVGPRIVLGDLNEWTRGQVTRILSGEFRFTDLRPHLPRTRTYPAVFPFLHLDHIYFDFQWKSK